jgi:hypothetical protein
MLSITSGALGNRDGRATLSSLLDDPPGHDGRALVLRWQEAGGPEGSPIARSRFGRVLLERIVPSALGGSATVENTAPGRIVYELRVPGAQFY